MVISSVLRPLSRTPSYLCMWYMQSLLLEIPQHTAGVLSSHWCNTPQYQLRTDCLLTPIYRTVFPLSDGICTVSTKCRTLSGLQRKQIGHHCLHRLDWGLHTPRQACIKFPSLYSSFLSIADFSKYSLKQGSFSTTSKLSLSLFPLPEVILIVGSFPGEEKSLCFSEWSDENKQKDSVLESLIQLMINPFLCLKHTHIYTLLAECMYRQYYFLMSTISATILSRSEPQVCAFFLFFFPWVNLFPHRGVL